MARVTLKMDVRNERSAKKIRKGLMNYVGGVERVEASVNSGLVVVWGSADAETLRSVLESLMKKAVTIVPEPEQPAPTQSSSHPPPAAPSQLTPGLPRQYYPQPMWPPPPQYYQQPPPPQYYQPPPFDHPQYAAPSLPPHYDSYSTTEGGSSGYQYGYNPYPAGPHHGEDQSTCSIQ
ncbi:extensin-like [Brachypodium distachyon]|uniref:extensin-like n=1 Tax=Brachypodium distachyon TaxID=15368 RepID=UPI00052FE951|nr:extensin-like [Brachypodium distachyon]|eukprot:XP_010233520.1 extensin-like [Brachypodium distachyon]